MTIQETSQTDGRVVLMPDANLVASTAPDMRARIKEVLGEGANQVVVDLSNVEIVDSTGIGLLVATHNSFSKAGGKLELINTSSELLDLFRSLRLDQHFSISGAGAKGN